MDFVRVPKIPKDELYLFPIGDVHYGNRHADLDVFQKYIDKIKEIDCKVILMGDLIEVANRNSPGASIYEQDVSPQKQIEWIVDVLRPIKDKIILLHGSNHERRVYKSTGVDITKNIARELGIKYCVYGAYTRITLNDVSYNIFSTHGSSGSKLRESKMKVLRDLARVNTNADLYLMGHVHTNYTSINPINVPDVRNKRVELKKPILQLTGHFLNYYNSYAEETNMSPEPPNMPIIRLDGLKHDIKILTIEDL